MRRIEAGMRATAKQGSVEITRMSEEIAQLRREKEALGSEKEGLAREKAELEKKVSDLTERVKTLEETAAQEKKPASDHGLQCARRKLQHGSAQDALTAHKSVVIGIVNGIHSGIDQ